MVIKICRGGCLGFFLLPRLFDENEFLFEALKSGLFFGELGFGLADQF